MIMAEKLQNADSGKEIKEKERNDNTTTEKVIRLRWQTLIISLLFMALDCNTTDDNGINVK